LQIIVICSIHQPSTVTFNMFDQLVLLARGALCYAGPVNGALDYFAEIGFPAPPQINPAEYLLDLVNADFSPSNKGQGTVDRVAAIHQAWRMHHKEEPNSQSSPAASGTVEESTSVESSKRRFLLPVLLHRAFIKSHRDLVAYGVRIAMYLVGLYEHAWETIR
jgi:ABC-type multidrug transport system ATPase subunit